MFVFVRVHIIMYKAFSATQKHMANWITLGLKCSQNNRILNQRIDNTPFRSNVKQSNKKSTATSDSW